MSTQQTKMVSTEQSLEPSNQEHFLFKSLFQTNENSSPGELRLDDNHSIIYRKQDGYIDVTQLCKAAGKKFNHWNSLEKTKGFLRVLSGSAGIPADLLIKITMDGPNENRGTWVHPQVAINIAQWISPEFDVLVSKWVFHIMLTGKVDLNDDEDGPRSSKELIEMAQDLDNPLRDEALQLSKEVDWTVTANNPGMYLYYIRGRVLKLGHGKNIMSLRDGTHKKDPEFGEKIILVYLWPSVNKPVEEEIHKQLKHMNANKEKTGKKETYILPGEFTLRDFIEMIGKYVDTFTKENRLGEENKELRHKLELETVKGELSACKKDNELLKKDLVIRDLELKLCKLEKIEKKDQNSSKPSKLSVIPCAPSLEVSVSQNIPQPLQVLSSDSRVCTTCKETKQVTEFHKRSDKCVNRTCKPCVAKQQKAYQGKKRRDGGVEEIVKESLERIGEIILSS